MATALRVISDSGVTTSPEERLIGVIRNTLRTPADIKFAVEYLTKGEKTDFFGAALILERSGDKSGARELFAAYAEQQEKKGHYMLAARVHAIDLGDLKEAKRVYYRQAKMDREIGRTGEAEALENELVHGRLPALTFGDNMPRLLRDKG